MQRVPRGTQVSTPQATEEHTVTFETARDVMISVARPDRCFSYYDEAYSENSRYLDPPPGAVADSFEILNGAQRIERYIYIGDQRFADTGESAQLKVYLGPHER